jgi:hypothetical protein
MNQGQFPGVPVTQEVSDHANNTLQGMINIASMRRDQAADNVQRIESAIAALDMLAQHLIETRQSYIELYQREEQNIAQYYTFATGQAPAPPPPQMMVPPPQNGTVQYPAGMPQMQQMPVQPQLPPQYIQQPTQLQPVPQNGPFGQGPLRPYPQIDTRPDAEGRRPMGVNDLTPEMRQRWKETPPVIKEEHRPGDPGYVSPSMQVRQLPIPVVAVPDGEMPGNGGAAPAAASVQVPVVSIPATPPPSDPPTS